MTDVLRADLRDRPRVHLRRFAEVREALRNDDLRQALYDGSRLMHDALIMLHGGDHRRRRRLEQPLFTREALAAYEARLAPIAERTLAPLLAAGRGDLVRFGREVTVNLSTAIAGIDRPRQDAAETGRLLGHLMTFMESATVANSARDAAEVEREMERAWADYLAEFLEPSIVRRRALIAAGGPPPADVLTTLLRHGAHLSDQAVRHETTMYMTASVGTASGVLVATFDELHRWWAERPERRDREAADPRFLQRAAWETIRLHPANPQHLRRAVRRVVLAGGIAIEPGQEVFLDVVAANRDRAVFGDTADRFDPERRPPAGVAPWGIGFGAGIHVCMGQNLAGGTEGLLGMLSVVLTALLRHRPAPDPDDPPRPAPETLRRLWASYPVVFA